MQTAARQLPALHRIQSARLLSDGYELTVEDTDDLEHELRVDEDGELLEGDAEARAFLTANRSAVESALAKAWQRACDDARTWGEDRR